MGKTKIPQTTRYTLTQKPRLKIFCGNGVPAGDLRVCHTYSHEHLKQSPWTPVYLHVKCNAMLVNNNARSLLSNLYQG